MLDEHEQEQDQNIKKNAAAINQMADYLHEIRDHVEPISAFVEKVPPRWKASMRLLRAIIGFGAIAAVILKGGCLVLSEAGASRNGGALHSCCERSLLC